MALPSSLGDYTKWDSTDILNRFKDGCKPTVEDWEAIRPYLFPMQQLINANESYKQFKKLYDRYITQGTVLDTDFFTSLFNVFIRDNNYPFWSNYINASSPYYKNSDFCLNNAFANGAKPNGTIFAEYLQALLSPVAFTDNHKTGFVLRNLYNINWMNDLIIQGDISILATESIRTYNYVPIFYNIYSKPADNSSFILEFRRQCVCAAIKTNLNVKFRLLCRGKITDVGENTLLQTQIDGLFTEKLTNPTLQQTNSSTFSINFEVNNVQPIFIVNAYSSSSYSEGMAVANLIGV